ncbi:MAG: sulfotransferase [Geminicoccaceae bacterium]
MHPPLRNTPRIRAKKIKEQVLTAAAGRITQTLLPDPTRFVTFTRGRTGSNLLASLLASHPQVRQHRELFGEFALSHGFILDEIRSLGPQRYFRRSTQRMLLERAVGVKFLYHHLSRAYARRWDVPDLPSLLSAIKEDRSIRIIHLKRRNLLKTLVSWKMAAATGEWESQTGPSSGNTKPQTITLTGEECLAEFRRTERLERHFDKIFVNHPFAEVAYEDLIENKTGESARVLDFLSLQHVDLQTPLKKQNTRSLHDTISNFRQLRDTFAGSPYASFFA